VSANRNGDGWADKCWPKQGISCSKPGAHCVAVWNKLDSLGAKRIQPEAANIWLVEEKKINYLINMKFFIIQKEGSLPLIGNNSMIKIKFKYLHNG
jgi:hypothetical protein